MTLFGRRGRTALLGAVLTVFCLWSLTYLKVSPPTHPTTHLKPDVASIPESADGRMDRLLHAQLLSQLGPAEAEVRLEFMHRQDQLWKFNKHRAMRRLLGLEDSGEDDYLLLKDMESLEQQLKRHKTLQKRFPKRLLQSRAHMRKTAKVLSNVDKMTTTEDINAFDMKRMDDITTTAAFSNDITMTTVTDDMSNLISSLSEDDIIKMIEALQIRLKEIKQHKPLCGEKCVKNIHYMITVLGCMFTVFAACGFMYLYFRRFKRRHLQKFAPHSWWNAGNKKNRRSMDQEVQWVGEIVMEPGQLEEDEATREHYLSTLKGYVLQQMALRDSITSDESDSESEEAF